MESGNTPLQQLSDDHVNRLDRRRFVQPGHIVDDVEHADIAKHIEPKVFSHGGYNEGKTELIVSQRRRQMSKILSCHIAPVRA